jgi:hypothetical protein
MEIHCGSLCRYIRRHRQALQAKDYLSPLSYEAELLALAVIFYLYDSSVLLYSNEAIFTCGRAQHWAATTRRSGFMFAGRSLRVLNPFTPHRPAFRLSWNFSRLESDGGDACWSARAQEFKILAPTTLIGGIALFLLLPMGMFSDLGRYAVIPALLLLYGSTVVALVRLRRKGLLGALGRWRFLGFAFECLACPPFAVNIVRRISLAERVLEPVPLAAVRLLDADSWARFRDECLSRLDEAMNRAAENSEDHKMLEAQKQHLSALVRHS